MTSREEIAEMLEYLSSRNTADGLRESEAHLEEVRAIHGPYPPLVEAIGKISRRIAFLETGEDLCGPSE